MDPAIRMTNVCECAARRRDDLVTSAVTALKPDGTHEQHDFAARASTAADDSTIQPLNESVETLGPQFKDARREICLAARCTSAKWTPARATAAKSKSSASTVPIYDIERFGIHFVASPRHADMLLVTGPVTRNMELALRKTYEATPEPRLVVAVGACGCSGGIFGQNYATCGGVD